VDLHRVLEAWDLPCPITFRPIDLGYFHLTSYVDTPGEAYVLRVFQQVGDLGQVQREQALMLDLAARSFPFAVPVPIPARSGERLVKTTDGYATLLPCLPGAHPDVTDLAQAYAYGQALGEIDRSLDRLAPVPVSPPYGALEEAHQLVDDPWRLPESLEVSPAWKSRIQRIFADLAEQVPALYRSLPQQVIHGDFVPRNALVQEGRVTGVLDFEFCAHDLRAMDLAIALGGGPSALRGPEGDLSVLDAIGRGYTSRVRLTPAELEALPTLIRLRRVNMLIRFGGNRRKGLRDARFMQGICHWLLEADDWLNAHGTDLLRLAQTW
jgi:homoserine kinase type II